MLTSKPFDHYQCMRTVQSLSVGLVQTYYKYHLSSLNFQGMKIISTFVVVHLINEKHKVQTLGACAYYRRQTRTRTASWSVSAFQDTSTAHVVWC